MYPTKLFTISEPQNLLNDVSELHEVGQSPDFEAPILCNVWSGRGLIYCRAITHQNWSGDWWGIREKWRPKCFQGFNFNKHVHQDSLPSISQHWALDWQILWSSESSVDVFWGCSQKRYSVRAIGWNLSQSLSQFPIKSPSKTIESVFRHTHSCLHLHAYVHNNTSPDFTTDKGERGWTLFAAGWTIISLTLHHCLGEEEIREKYGPGKKVFKLFFTKREIVGLAPTITKMPSTFLSDQANF